MDESQECSFDCPVCLQFLSDPRTTECCNKDFCRSCIVKIRKGGGQCPLCRDAKFKTKRNNDLDHELHRLQVYCANRSKGCQWIGDLGEVKVHLNLNPIARYQSNGCQFVELKCAFCSAQYTRREIPEHLTKCPKRPFTCKYCQKYNSYYDDVCNHHLSVCECYPILCPNGCSETIPRRSIGEHIENDCTHIHEDVNVFFMALMSIQSHCPFVHKYDNLVVKLINQILNLDHKYVIATFFCLAIAFLIIVYFWLTTP